MSENTNKMHDKLVELIAAAKNAYYDYSYEKYEKGLPVEKSEVYIADHLLANGVVALPYEEGQLVYVLRSKTLNGKNLYLKKEIISHYRIFKDSAYMCFKTGGLSVRDNLWKETVFPTEEEAEQALKIIREARKC